MRKTYKMPGVYEQRSRFDFTSDLREVSMINGDSLDNYETEEEKQELMNEFRYLLNLEEFATSLYQYENDNSGEVFFNSFDKDTQYLDFVQKGTPEEDGKTWLYEEWWEDDKGNKAEYYSEPDNKWKIRGNDLIYAIAGNDTIPCITRSLYDNEVTYDYRLSNEENKVLYGYLWYSSNEIENEKYVKDDFNIEKDGDYEQDLD